MKCENAQELYSEYLESTLERPMAVAFEAHLAECAECEREYALFRTTWEMIDSLPQVEPPPGFAYNVAMTLRMRKEETERSQPKWRLALSDLFASRVVVRAFAAAVVVLLAVQLAMYTPLKDMVSAQLWGGMPVFKVESGAWETPSRNTSLDTGLNFRLGGSTDSEGVTVFRLLLKPQHVTSKEVRVYLMPSGETSFSANSLGQAKLLLDEEIGDAGRAVPFILGANDGKQQVMTALVEWEHHRRGYSEAVFVPSMMGKIGSNITADLSLDEVDLYAALRQVSAKYGAVILSVADADAQVSNIELKDASVEDALYQITKSVGLKFRLVGARVYIVERRIE